MGMRAASSYTKTQINAIQGGTTEVVLFTTAPVILALDNAQVVLAWMLAIIAGAATTSVSIQIRRGTTITGTFVGTPPWISTVAAGSLYVLNGWFADMPGVALTQYSLTMFQNTGSSASTYQDGCFLAFVL